MKVVPSEIGRRVVR